MAIVIAKEDLDRLNKLILKTEKGTSLIAALAAGLSGLEEGNEMAQAKKELRRFWEELCKKYNFNPNEVKRIDSNTGEVFF